MTGLEKTTQAGGLALETLTAAMSTQQQQLSTISTSVLKQEEHMRQLVGLVPIISQESGETLTALAKTIDARLRAWETILLEAPRNYSQITARGPAGSALERTINPSLDKPNYQVDHKRVVPTRSKQVSTLLDPACSCSLASSGRRHRPGCLGAFLVRENHSFAGQLRLFSYLISLKVVVSYSRRAILRDFRVHPNFTVRAVCPRGSPAFTLMGSMNLSLDAGELRHELRRVLVGLRILFMEGKAWPTDIEVDGRSLFYVGNDHAILF